MKLIDNTVRSDLGMRIKHLIRAFSLVELLVVIAVTGILVGLAFPVLSRAMAKSRQIQCLNQLREAGVAFQSFAQDHSDRLPMQLWTNGCSHSNHTHEVIATNALVRSSCAFLAMSNELATPRILACFAEKRQPANDFRNLTDDNVSYVVGVQAALARPTSVLALDGNLTHSTGPVKIDLTTGGIYNLAWTRLVHGGKGNVLYADGHVELRKNLNLNVLPTVEPSLEPVSITLTNIASPPGTVSQRTGFPVAVSPRLNLGGGVSSMPSPASASALSTEFAAGTQTAVAPPSVNVALNPEGATNSPPAQPEEPQPKAVLAPANIQNASRPSTALIPPAVPYSSGQRPSPPPANISGHPAMAASGGGSTALGDDWDTETYRGIVFGAKIIYLLLLLWAIGVMLLYVLKYWWARKGRPTSHP